MQKYIIYCHTNRNNQKRYIGWAKAQDGQTPHFAMTRRWETHCRQAEVGSTLLLSNAIRKHGKDVWDHELLDVMTTEEGVKHAEKLWIAQRKTCVVDFPETGYNMTRGDGGGMLGHVPSPEHRKNLSIALTGIKRSKLTREKMSRAKSGKQSSFKGKHHTPEWKKRHTGEGCGASKLTETLKLEIITRWENRVNVPVTQYKLAADYNVTQSTVSRLVNRKTWKT